MGLAFLKSSWNAFHTVFKGEERKAVGISIYPNNAHGWLDGIVNDVL